MSSPFEKYQKAGLQHEAKKPEAPLPPQESFLEELANLVNRHNKEKGSGTPDFVLANYLQRCLETFDATIGARAEWRGERIDAPFVYKPDGKVKINVYEADGRKNEIGQASLELWPGEVARRGPVVAVIPIFADISQVPSGWAQAMPIVERKDEFNGPTEPTGQI